MGISDAPKLASGRAAILQYLKTGFVRQVHTYLTTFITISPRHKSASHPASVQNQTQNLQTAVCQAGSLHKLCQAGSLHKLCPTGRFNSVCAAFPLPSRVRSSSDSPMTEGQGRIYPDFSRVSISRVSAIQRSVLLSHLAQPCQPSVPWLLVPGSSAPQHLRTHSYASDNA